MSNPRQQVVIKYYVEFDIEAQIRGWFSRKSLVDLCYNLHLNEFDFTKLVKFEEHKRTITNYPENGYTDETEVSDILEKVLNEVMPNINPQLREKLHRMKEEGKYEAVLTVNGDSEVITKRGNLD